MVETKRKVGIVSCSGEEIPEGTVSRNAVRRVLEHLRPGRTVTICLPLFLAGSEEERDFARKHPTITVDGCAKLCAKRGTERHSGPVGVSLVVTDVLGVPAAGCVRSGRGAGEADAAAAWVVADHIAAAVDTLLDGPGQEGDMASAAADQGCACTRPLPGRTVTVAGQAVAVDGLDLIFGQLAEEGVPGDDSAADAVLERVKIYHGVPKNLENEFRCALLGAYQEYRRKK